MFAPTLFQFSDLILRVLKFCFGLLFTRYSLLIYQWLYVDLKSFGRAKVRIAARTMQYYLRHAFLYIFTHEHLLEFVVHGFFVHSLDDRSLLFDLVEIIAGMGSRYRVVSRTTSDPTSTPGLFWSAEPCVQLKHNP
ncbi:hypothetical protein WN55_04441 [Dufourea novaeangliae]|uniref:Uncharacterized protein n=1 Tax=Dufourea novaeangliae TaxID=178035 RepID=A0A154PM64_DUFNO|nr:hypothetical protein WN55_04441 [Dufourea novaeangliae]